MTLRVAAILVLSPPSYILTRPVATLAGDYTDRWQRWQQNTLDRVLKLFYEKNANKNCVKDTFTILVFS